MVTTLDEGKLRFVCDGLAVKFDDEQGYYGKYFKSLPGGKGVDFIFVSPNAVQLIEVKDWLGYEEKNRGRVIKDNKSKSRPLGKDSVDIEVSKKAASTIASLYGAWTMEPRRPALATKLTAFGMRMNDKRMQMPQKPPPLKIVLFLEGNFTFQSQTKKVIMETLRESIQRKLLWLNCQAVVMDSSTYEEHKPGFEVIRLT